LEIGDYDSKGRPIFRDVLDPNSTVIRQNLIRTIEEEIDSALVTYTANLGSPGSGIMVQDAALFEDVLRSVSTKKKGVLMLTSAGGDSNAAEKLMQMCRKRFDEGFQIIVPFYAKSAATLMCLGADKIMMGYGAELGPVDPQVQMIGSATMMIPARAYIDGLEDIRQKVLAGDPVSLYYGMLQQVRPEYLVICQNAIDDSRATAERWLTSYMLKHDPTQAKQVASWLCDGKKYKSHGKPIEFVEVRDELKLNVEELNNMTPLWQKIWELYIRSAYYLQNIPGTAKLFESSSNSLSLKVNLMVTETPKRQS
jgi:ClpP class serine protease